MLDPNKSTGQLHTAACHTPSHSDGFRTNSLFDAWRQDLQLSNQGHFRGTRNGGDRQLLLDILDEALEITSFPIPGTGTATSISTERIYQHQSLPTETSMNSDDENRVSASVNTIDIDSTLENTTRGQIPRTGSSVKQRRANKKLPDRNRQ